MITRMVPVMFRISSQRIAYRVALSGAGLGSISIAVAFSTSSNPKLTQLSWTFNDGELSSIAKRHDRLSLYHVITPTIQATFRIFRLARTAMLMALDYKLAANPLWMRLTKPYSDYCQSVGSEDELLYWEVETKRRRSDFHKAQEIYSTESHPNLDVHSRLQIKQYEKRAMLQAAQTLAEAEEKISEIGSLSSRSHYKAAHRLLSLCQTNKGVYIKVGQHLASLDYLIPREYIDTLAVLFDRNPTSSIEDVRQVIYEDLGSFPEDIFESFEISPIASASLAQVHVAIEKESGRKLAVKVQHRGLLETSRGDLLALVSFVRLAEYLFDDFKFGWLADEIAPLLPKELDFKNEGENSERAARFFATTRLDCVIPKILWTYSSPRVLTMEFEEGFKATDIEAMESHGLQKQDVAKLIASVFSSQVFLSGWVHCDPHPANVLIRATPLGKPQLVLVDHGLYRELDPDFTKKYARLWKSLMLADLAGIKNACQDLGVEQTYALFSAMLTARPFDEIIERSKKGFLHDQSQGTAESRSDQTMIRGYAQRFLFDIFDLLSTLPRQMLLLLKMNDCLRHIDYCLGSPTNTVMICGKYAAISLYHNTMREASSLRMKINALWNFIQVMARIYAHDLYFHWVQVKVIRYY